MNSIDGKPFRKIKLIRSNKSLSSPRIFRYTNPTIYNQNNWFKGKSLYISKSQLFQLNNSSLKNQKYIYDSYSSKLNPINSTKKILYEDIIKLKSKLNKLELELIFTKCENRKKDEQIKNAERVLEKTRNKTKEKNFIEKLKGESQIIKLKETYQNLQKEKSKFLEENNRLEKNMKITDISDIKQNEINLNILKDKINEYKTILMNNKKYDKELQLFNFNKIKFFNNHIYLEKILKEIEIKNNKMNILRNTLLKLKDKYNKIDENKNRIIRYNDSLEKLNNKLLIDKKKRQDFIMKKPDIIFKINEYGKKIKDLEDKEKNMENNFEINKKKIIENKETYKIDIENNPDDMVDPKIILFESLIKESKDRQNEFIQLFEYYNDYIVQKNNYEKIIQEKNTDSSNGVNSPTQPNLNQKNLEDEKNNNIKKDKNDNIKDKNKKQGNKFNNFKFMLSIMFYIKKIPKEKIENILLNFKTQNYYIDNLKDKEIYTSNISKDILNLINDKNENDIKLLKKIFINLLEEKYENNKELFLNNVIKDIIDNNALPFNISKENDLLEKIKKMYNKSSKNIIEKISKFNNKIISYKNIKKIFKEEKLYIKKNKEKEELFQFFIYIIKKNSYINDDINNNNSINDLMVEDVIKFFNSINNNEKSLSNINEENALNNFIIQLKKMLDEKKINLKQFIGESNIKYIKKDEKEIDVINVNKFSDLLKINEFKLEKVLNINFILSHYKIDDNSEDININILENDLKKIN